MLDGDDTVGDAEKHLAQLKHAERVAAARCGHAERALDDARADAAGALVAWHENGRPMSAATREHLTEHAERVQAAHAAWMTAAAAETEAEGALLAHVHAMSEARRAALEEAHDRSALLMGEARTAEERAEHLAAAERLGAELDARPAVDVPTLAELRAAVADVPAADVPHLHDPAGCGVCGGALGA